MKKEKIVKKILVKSLAGFPVGVMLLMLAYASVYFIVEDNVFNTELNQLHNINTLLTQIISVGIAGYMLFAIFGIINVSGNKEVENNLIKKYPWKIALIILIEIILCVLILVILGSTKIFSKNISNINILILVIICVLSGIVICIKNLYERHIIKEINQKIKERNS